MQRLYSTMSEVPYPKGNYRPVLRSRAATAPDPTSECSIAAGCCARLSPSPPPQAAALAPHLPQQRPDHDLHIIIVILTIIRIMKIRMIMIVIVMMIMMIIKNDNNNNNFNNHEDNNSN